MVVSHVCGAKYMSDCLKIAARLHLYLVNHFKIVTLEVHPILPKNRSWEVIFPWDSYSISIISHENRHYTRQNGENIAWSARSEMIPGTLL